MAGSTLRTLPASPTRAAPNHDGDSSAPTVCEATRTGVLAMPMLVLCGWPGAPMLDAMLAVSTSLGRAGTGGRCWALPEKLVRWLPRLPGRWGLGLRKVRSVMEALLPRRCRPGRAASAATARARAGRRVLPWEDTEALRRCVRFVWTAPTLIGLVGRARRAAAAAAADSDGFDPRRLKTAAAAVAALGSAVAAVRGCGQGGMISLRCGERDGNLMWDCRSSMAMTTGRQDAGRTGARSEAE